MREIFRFIVGLVTALIVVIGCGGNSRKDNASIVPENNYMNNDSIVYLLYFHSQNRCINCVKVGDIARRVVNDNFTDNPRVDYWEIMVDDPIYREMVQAHDVKWNALILVRGKKTINITRDAYTYAPNNPFVTYNLIHKNISALLNDNINSE